MENVAKKLEFDSFDEVIEFAHLYEKIKERMDVDDDFFNAMIGGEERMMSDFEDKLRELEAIEEGKFDEDDPNGLSRFSTTQLKAELRRRKGEKSGKNQGKFGPKKW